MRSFDLSGELEFLLCFGCKFMVMFWSCDFEFIVDFGLG